MMFFSNLLLMTIATACSDGSPQTPAVDTGVSIVAVGSLAADGTDRSGLSDPIPGTKIPQSLVGSIGSALTYTGTGNLYLALNDRGPRDGAVAFIPRFQTLEIELDAAKHALKLSLRATTIFTNEAGEKYSGLTSDFEPKAPQKSRRLDPEGVRVSRKGTLFTSDEYGPAIDEWSMDGVHLRRLALPKKFAIDHASADAAEELPPKNVAGRQANRGMEGLARSPDGTRLYGIMQSPLIQDGGLDEKNKRVGTNARVLEIALGDGATREFLYCLDSGKNGLNEILAVGAGTFLVIERDSNHGAEAACKRVYKISIEGASDISKLEALPAQGVPPEVVPVKKELLIDFLDPRFGLAGEQMPEKIEGLTFGPDLPDGRRLLLVSIDNDFKTDVPNTIWAFAIDRARLAGFEPVQFDAR